MGFPPNSQGLPTNCHLQKSAGLGGGTGPLPPTLPSALLLCLGVWISFPKDGYLLVPVVQSSAPHPHPRPIQAKFSAVGPLPGHIRIQTNGRWEEGSGNSEPLRGQAILLLSGFMLIPKDLTGKPNLKQTF